MIAKSAMAHSARVSPVATVSCAQDRLQQVLLSALRAQGVAEVRYGVEVTHVQQREGVFGRPWDLWSYLDVTGAGRILSLTPETQTYALALVAMALPFIAVGTWLTVRRLRTVGLPPWLVVLFFVPVLNLVLFARGMPVTKRFGEFGRLRTVVVAPDGALCNVMGAPRAPTA